jgi:hypothetical protein
MSLQRSTVLDALFTLLSASAAYVTTGRRLMHWTEVPAANQPALFQRLVGEDFAPLKGYGLPQEVTLKVEVWIYVNTQGPDSTPEDTILPLLDALDTALAKGAAFDGRQQLGLEGYVQHAWREGETTIAQGELDSQAICITTVHILVTAPFSTT